jgi:hypothetical protein
MENGYLTLKQALKNVAGEESNFSLKQECGFLKTATTT